MKLRVQSVRRDGKLVDQVAAERDGDLDLLRLAMTLAHNRGDLTQGMGFWKKTPVTLPLMEHFHHAGPLRSGSSHIPGNGAFG